MRRLAFLLVSITITYAYDRENVVCDDYDTRQEAFCGYDFVAHVVVTSKRRITVGEGWPRYTYDVEYIEIFKGDGELPKIVMAYPTDHIPKRFHGVDLEKGKEYVIAGQAELNTWLNDCPVRERLLTEWDQLSEEEKNELRTFEC
ncbi:unnamed protein product [Cylicocyclus nassatus]|uniref:NTR domain-containing protein n=1 Tax=Cylicocyclus nassatus TaxID=53992 RepID=A0AA36GY54_CYLNA|nr:unnamed protein product [Cylicocyclus nassatus]